MKIRPSLPSRAALLAGCSAFALALSSSLAGAASVVSTTVIEPGSLVVSSSTYDNTQGAIASLAAGTTQLPDSKSKTTAAIAGNDYVHTWDNVTADPAYGVTAPISLTDIDPATGNVLHSIAVPTDQVVTSFSSKSELGLHVIGQGAHHHLTFVGYASPGVGAIDASNSDAVAGQDPTNPVTFASQSGALPPNYAFHRTIVTMSETGHFLYTPTVAYGGNNGRSALLGPNQLYYMVGNANNGDASTFGPGNGTNPDVTETTGLEVVNPIFDRTASVTIPSNNSAEIDPLLQFTFSGKLDKAGKDTNFRGITEFQGKLYFTKGSGSNGIDTVYTVDQGLPTVANASSATISIVPGFPTDFAKATGGTFTPFAVFFVNPQTMYVTDEGSGNSTDTSTNAGLQKWSLDTSSGTWHLDYVLRAGLVGATDTGLTGSDGPWPDITTVGLRNLTGRVNGDGTVTLWAITATSSSSGDNGADPNKVVKIADKIRATSASEVAAESFEIVLGPAYGTVYRGVAYAR